MYLFLDANNKNNPTATYFSLCPLREKENTKKKKVERSVSTIQLERGQKLSNLLQFMADWRRANRASCNNLSRISWMFDFICRKIHTFQIETKVKEETHTCSKFILSMFIIFILHPKNFIENDTLWQLLTKR